VGIFLHSMRVYSRFLSQYLNYYFRKRAICATRFLRIRFILFPFTYFTPQPAPFMYLHMNAARRRWQFFCSELPTMRLRVEKSVVMLKYYTWTRRNQSFLAKTPHIFSGMTADWFWVSLNQKGRLFWWPKWRSCYKILWNDATRNNYFLNHWWSMRYM